MLPSFLAWLLGSRIGRYLAAAIAIGLALLWAFRHAYTTGKEAANIAVEREKYRSLKNAVLAHKEVGEMSDDERFRFVSRFLRE